VREILFRGKEKETGEWVIGYYAKRSDDNGAHIVFDVMFSPRGLCDNTHWVYDVIFVREKCEYVPKVVDELSVGQFIGMTDQNEVRIFEGDYLRDSAGNVGLVFYSGSDARFLVNWRKQDFGCEIGSCLNFVEVIGNIHDNFEMLEGIKEGVKR
jgi:hypothetical protein